MKYKVAYKGGADGTKVEERIIDAALVQVGEQMTTLLSHGSEPYALLIVPNDRVISIEKIA